MKIRAEYHSVQNPSSHAIFKTLNITNETVPVPVVLYGYETRSLTRIQKEERRLREWEPTGREGEASVPL